MGGISMMLWGTFLRVVIGLHATWLVNSATHLFGSRRFETKDDSRNSWWVALLTGGEGWHNNHHAHPVSARHGLTWYEFDVNYYGIWLMETAGARPVVTPGSIGIDIEGRDVVLCDDVLYTGRTIRAALDALFDHGRPRRVQLAVLIDRGHRELPIEATYIGKHVPTSSREIIEVKFREIDNDEQVLLVERTD